MALDPFSAVLGFLAFLEAGLGAAVVALGWREFRLAGAAPSEARRPLLPLVAAAAVAAAALSFPLHYLLLESWVPRWPGILCVEGVRRIGTGSLGAAGILPWLVQALDLTRLLVIFAGGSWAILRRVPGVPAARRAAAAAILLGALAALDGAAAFSYVCIPKREVLPAGCCTAPRLGPKRDAGLVADGTAGRGAPGPAAYAGATALLGAGAWLLRGRRLPRASAALALLSAASLPLAAGYLAGTAGPAVLGLPHHRCAWCALAGAPETVAWAALHLGAVLCAGWGAVAGGGGRRFHAAAAAGFLAAAALGAALPAAGPALRGDPGDRCVLDGVRLDPARVVRVTDAGGADRALCCVECARRWLALEGRAPRRILVVDEATGASLPCTEAWFVESLVPALPATGCRIHSFAREADARRHAADFGGTVLEAGLRPLRSWEEGAR